MGYISQMHRLITSLVFPTSPLFNMMHASDVLGRVRDKIRIVGLLAPGYSLKVAGLGEELDEVEARRAELPPVESVLNLAQFERMARDVLGAESRGWKFYSSYADDGASESKRL